jgi:hypothetical protein
MQTRTAPLEIQRRFSCISTKKAEQNELTHDDITRQIAEFLKRGGNIKPIPTGVSATAPGQVLVGSEKQAMATPRPSKASKRTVSAPNSEFITIQEAADLTGRSGSNITKQIHLGVLTAKAMPGTRALFVSRQQVLALPPKKENKK